MSESRKAFEDTFYHWWSQYIAPRDGEVTHRGCASRLRRATAIAALCEPAVHELAQKLGATERDAHKLAGVVSLLAEIRENVAQSLPQTLGSGEKPALSQGRFENLMRAEDQELITLLRRAIYMADRRCNVGKLAADVWHWNEKTRTQWCFSYFGAEKA